MTVLPALGLAALLLAALLIALLHALGDRPARVPPARPRATFLEALDDTGDDVDGTVFRDGS